MTASALISEIRTALDHAEAGIVTEFAANGASPRYFDQMHALLEVREQLLARVGAMRFETPAFLAQVARAERKAGEAFRALREGTQSDADPSRHGRRAVPPATGADYGSR